MSHANYQFYQNFKARKDLSKYTDNALLLYTLQLKFGIEDIDEVAITSLVDGSDDKKTDIVYINDETNEAVIGQGYFSSKYKEAAPSNKASDLNISIPWLLSRDIEEVPERIKSAAKELRQKIKDGEVTKISIWYCHNLPESQNVKEELKTAEHTLSAALKTDFADNKVEIQSLEIGLNTIEELYKSLTIPILVNDKIKIEGCSGFESSGPNWTAFTTSIPARLLYSIYKEHKTNLFSANVRDYLGSRQSDSNINHGIKTTASGSPADFFVFNNGITALVNNFEYKRRKLLVEGMSIVNGAQTTGAIGSLPSPPSEDLVIPIKFIKCDDKNTIASIVKFNNSQNKMNAPDFRSSDQYQKRITQEFKALGKIDYTARRGGAQDIISRTTHILPSITAGQVLAAFHGDPSTAYNDKTKIWDEDRLYTRYFNEQTTAKHIFMCYSLVKAIEELKYELMNSAGLITAQETLLKYLRSRGSIILLATAISDSLEVLIGKKITNKFSLHFCKNIDFEAAKKNWTEIIMIGSSFVHKLQEGLDDGIKNEKSINKSRTDFVSLMDAVKGGNAVVLKKFGESICL